MLYEAWEQFKDLLRLYSVIVFNVGWLSKLFIMVWP